MTAAGVIVSSLGEAQASVLAGATAAIYGESTHEFLNGESPLSGVTLAMNQALMDAAGENYDDEDIYSDVPRPEDPLAEAPELDYDITAVAQVDDYVNVREEPDENSRILGKLYKDCIGTVLGEEDGWIKIKSGSIEGFVKSEYVCIGDEALIDSVAHYRAKVTADALKMREETNTDCGILDMAWNGERLDILDDELYDQGWIEVQKGDTTAYVASAYVDVAYEFDYAESREEELARLAEEARLADLNGSSLGVQICNYALQFVGNPYRWGGVSLTNGADCSGFLLSVFGHFGYYLPHSSYADRSMGRAVSRDEMRPGDIICYSGHVALYIGNGQIVHAASRRSGIKVSNAFYRSVVAIRRII